MPSEKKTVICRKCIVPLQLLYNMSSTKGSTKLRRCTYFEIVLVFELSLTKNTFIKFKPLDFLRTFYGNKTCFYDLVKYLKTNKKCSKETINLRQIVSNNSF